MDCRCHCYKYLGIKKCRDNYVLMTWGRRSCNAWQPSETDCTRVTYVLALQAEAALNLLHSQASGCSHGLPCTHHSLFHKRIFMPVTEM